MSTDTSSPVDTPLVERLLDEALVSQGYHGLYNDHYSCACRVGDLVPCGLDPTSCRAGWLVLPDRDDMDFNIGPTPPLTAADLTAISQQQIPGLNEEETE